MWITLPCERTLTGGRLRWTPRTLRRWLDPACRRGNESSEHRVNWTFRTHTPSIPSGMAWVASSSVWLHCAVCSETCRVSRVEQYGMECSYLVVGFLVRCGKLWNMSMRSPVTGPAEHHLSEELVSSDTLCQLSANAARRATALPPTADVEYPSRSWTSRRILSINSAAIARATSCQVVESSPLSTPSSSSSEVPCSPSEVPWSSSLVESVVRISVDEPPIGMTVPRLSHMMGGGGGRGLSAPSGASDGTCAR